MAETFLRIRGGPGPHDLMTWPNPADPNDVEWRLRNTATARREDVLVAASVMQAYRALVALPQRERNARIQQIRAAVAADAESGGSDHA